MISGGIEIQKKLYHRCLLGLIKFVRFKYPSDGRHEYFLRVNNENIKVWYYGVDFAFDFVDLLVILLSQG